MFEVSLAACRAAAPLLSTIPRRAQSSSVRSVAQTFRPNCPGFLGDPQQRPLSGTQLANLGRIAPRPTGAIGSAVSRELITHSPDVLLEAMPTCY